MKTIAVSIDEPTLGAIDRLVSRQKGGRKAPSAEAQSRSEIVRIALHEYLERELRRRREEKERRIWLAHIDEINRDAGALIGSQADLP